MWDLGGPLSHSPSCALGSSGSKLSKACYFSAPLVPALLLSAFNYFYSTLLRAVVVPGRVFRMPPSPGLPHKHRPLLFAILLLLRMLVLPISDPTAPALVSFLVRLLHILVRYTQHPNLSKLADTPRI